MPRPLPFEAEIAAALDWWREAGVDADYCEAPRRWLAEAGGAQPATALAEPASPPAGPAADRAPAAPRIGGPAFDWPQDLAAFRHWWLTEPSLDDGGLAPRVAPAGPAGADLMVVVAMPEQADRETLLSDALGRLLDGFLSAAGIAPDTVYRASVLPRHSPLPDWPAIAQQGMDAVLAHHVALVRPRRMLVLGRNILPLWGHDPAQGTQKLRSFNHEGGKVPALYEVGLERLRDSWQSRARLWNRWLEWTDGEAWREQAG